MASLCFFNWVEYFTLFTFKALYKCLLISLQSHLKKYIFFIMSMNKVETERTAWKSHFPYELLPRKTSCWYWWWEIWRGQGSSSHQHANAAICRGPWIEDMVVELTVISHSNVTIIPTYWWNCSSGNVLWTKISTDTAKEICPQPSLLGTATQFFCKYSH